MPKKYHISKDGTPRECRATIQGCRLGLSEGEHYTSREEAQRAFESKNSQKFFNFSKEYDGFAYQRKANIEIQAKDSYLRMLGNRQFKDTAYQNLSKDFSQKDIIYRTIEKLEPETASLGFVENSEKEDRIVGLRSYYDNGSPTDHGFYDDFSERLNFGRIPDDYIQYTERSNFGIMVLRKNEETYSNVDFDYASRDFLEKSINTHGVIKKYSLKTENELDDLIHKHGLDPNTFPNRKEKIRFLSNEESFLEKERMVTREDYIPDNNYYSHTRTYIDYKGNLVMTSRDPIVKNMMRNLNNVHKDKHLRVTVDEEGNAIFYDDRDRSPESEKNSIMQKHFVNSAKDRISEIHEKLLERDSKAKVLPVDREGNVNEAKYFVSYSPSNSRKKINGIFTKKELGELF